MRTLFRCLVRVLAFVLLLAAPPLLAQPARNAAAPPRPLPRDQSSNVALRAPTAERLRSFREQRDFQYVTV